MTTQHPQYELKQKLDAALRAEENAWAKVAQLEDVIEMAGDTRTRILAELIKAPQFCKTIRAALSLDNKTINSALNKLEKEGKVRREKQSDQTGLLLWSTVKQ